MYTKWTQCTQNVQSVHNVHNIHKIYTMYTKCSQCTVEIRSGGAASPTPRPLARLALSEIITWTLYSFKHCLAHQLQPLNPFLIMCVSTPRCAYQEDSSLHPSWVGASSLYLREQSYPICPLDMSMVSLSEASGSEGSCMLSDHNSSSSQNFVLFTPPTYVPIYQGQGSLFNQ